MNIFKSKWGKWTDISTGAMHETRFLLQARRHKKGKVQFRVEKSPDAWGCEMISMGQLEKVVYEINNKLNT